MQGKKKRDNAARDSEQAKKRAAEEANGIPEEAIKEDKSNLLNEKDEDGQYLLLFFV